MSKNLIVAVVIVTALLFSSSSAFCQVYFFAGIDWMGNDVENEAVTLTVVTMNGTGGEIYDEVEMVLSEGGQFSVWKAYFLPDPLSATWKVELDTGGEPEPTFDFYILNDPDDVDFGDDNWLDPWFHSAD